MKAPYLYDLPTFWDVRGNLTVIERGLDVQFDIKRIFWIHGASGTRGGHAHKRTQQILIALAGSLKVGLESNDYRGVLKLDSPTKALYVPTETVVDLYAFSPDAVLLVLCSEPFDEEDYIHAR